MFDLRSWLAAAMGQEGGEIPKAISIIPGT